MNGKGIASPAFSKIVVPVDGSENSYKATRVAASIAKRQNSELILLHVIVKPRDVMGDEPGSFQNEFWKRLRERGNDITNRAAALAREQGVDVRIEISEEVASAVQGITNFAGKEKADLIVIGTRGLGGFKKLLMGSVSSGVVSHADCSVLVVR